MQRILTWWNLLGRESLAHSHVLRHEPKETPQRLLTLSLRRCLTLAQDRNIDGDILARLR